MTLTIEQSIEQARERQLQGQIEESRKILNALLAGGVQQASHHKNIKIFRRSVSLSPQQRVIIGRCLITLIPLQATPQQILSDFNLLQKQMPELEHTAEAWLLKGEVAWKLEQMVLAQTCFVQAQTLLDSQSAEQWALCYLPWCHDLLHLRLGLLALNNAQHKEAETHFQALQSQQREFSIDRLQKMYGEFMLDPMRVQLSDIEHLVSLFGLMPLPLRLLKQFLTGHDLEPDALLSLLFKAQSTGLERRFLLHLMSTMPIAEQTRLLQQAFNKNWQPEWAYALGMIALSQADLTRAYEVWSRIWSQPKPVPIYILRDLARLLQESFPAEARRCLQLALLQQIEESWLCEYEQLLLDACAACQCVYQLIIEPDWANGGDLAIKTMIETFSAADPILFHIPASWSHPLVQQALQWACSLPVNKLPLICCGDLPAALDGLRKIRLAPWRLPIQREDHLTLEIQPQPEDPHLGPLYYLSQDPQQAGLWLETDSYSLSRWLNAARWYDLPTRPLLESYGLKSRPAKVSFLCEHAQSLSPEWEALLKQLGCQILMPGPLQNLSDLLPLAKGEWIFYLWAHEEMQLPQFVALQQYLISLPPEIQALTFRASSTSRPDQSWPVIRCLRRHAVLSLCPGEFVPTLNAGQTDLSSWSLPEIQIVKQAQIFLSPLDRAWQAYEAQDFESVQDYLQQAGQLWPLSQGVQLSLQELRLAIDFAQNQCESLYQKKIQFPSAMSYYWQGKAALACGQKQMARTFFEQSLETYDQLQPTYLSLLPCLPRDVIKVAYTKLRR